MSKDNLRGSHKGSKAGSHEGSKAGSRGGKSGRDCKFGKKLSKRPPLGGCEITGNPTACAEACHIFPVSISRDNDAKPNLWKLLRCFWPAETVDAIIEYCDPINHFSNGIMMGRDCHVFFDPLYFYLSPNVDTITPTSLTATFGWSGGARNVYSYVLNRDLQTGEIIKFETQDPVGLPLPDPALLLNRAKVSMVQFPKAGGACEGDEYNHSNHSSLISTSASLFSS